MSTVMQGRALTLIVTGVSTGIALLMGGKTYIQRQVAKTMKEEKFYTKTMDLFGNYPTGVEMVGEPYTEKRLFVQDIKRNWTDGFNARIMIEVLGNKKNALIHSWSHKVEETGEWQVDKCDLECDKQRWTFYLNPHANGVFEVTKLGEGYVEYPKGWIKQEYTRTRLGVDTEE